MEQHAAGIQDVVVNLNVQVENANKRMIAILEQISGGTVEEEAE